MKQFQVVKYFRYTILVPAIIIIAALISIAVRGVNLGIDFAGGTMITMDLGAAAEGQSDAELSAQLETIVAQHTDSDFRVSISSGTEVIVHIQDSDEEREAQISATNELEEAVRAVYPDMKVVSAESVGAVVGAELVKNAITALLLASALMLIYISLRFEVWSGIATIFGQFHDILVMLSITILLNLKINTSLVAAVLTVMGYSINNTIIVLDRVREYRRTNTTHMTREDIVNQSVTKTFMRSINTSLTTLFTVGALFVMGVTSVKEFTLPIIIGIFAGMYSSILLSGPFWAKICGWAEQIKENRSKKQRSSKKK